MASVIGEDKHVYTVLFVDDEENILRSIRRAVMDEDYMSYFANSGAEALKIMEKREINVLVTDMRMPGMDGLQLLKIVKEKYPNTVKIVLSGFTQLSQVLATVNQADIFNFIAKPWDMESELKYVIDKAIEHCRLKRIEIRLQGQLEQRNITYQNMLKKMDTTATFRAKQMLKIKKISKFLLEALIEETNGRSRFLATVLHHYAEKLPGAVEEIGVENLIADLQALVTENPFFQKAAIQVKESVTGKVHASSSMIYFAVTSLLNLLAENDNNEDVYIYIVSKEQEEKVVLSFSLFLLDKSGTYGEQVAQCSYQSIEQVFREIMDTRFVILNKNQRQIFQLEFELEKV